MVRIVGSSEVANVTGRTGPARRIEGGTNVVDPRPLLAHLVAPACRMWFRSRRLDWCTTVWSGWFESAGAPVVREAARPFCCLDSGRWRKRATGSADVEKRTDH